MSRVCLPKDQDRGEGKGLSPRFRPSRPEREAKPGRRITSCGLSFPWEWSAVVDSAVFVCTDEVMTSCHDFIFI